MEIAKLHLHWRVSRHNGKEYKSYSLARSYRTNGKNRKEIVLKLGKLTDCAVEQWRSVLRFFKNPNTTFTNMHDLVVTSNRAYLDLAVVREVWNLWGLSEIFDSADCEKRNVPLSAIAAMLTINRCIDPKSKSRVPNWFARTTLPFLLNIDSAEINSARIFRELSKIENCKDSLVKHLCNKMLKDYPEEMKSLFYDLSSTTFTGSQCSLIKWGYCKEGYHNHVVLALVVNTLGLPIYWEVLQGGTKDVTTISWLLARLKERLPVTIPTMVFDRGMVSEENLDLLEENGVKYITAMDRNQIEGLCEFDFTQFANFTREGIEEKLKVDFVKLNKHTYCNEITVIDKRRYVLCFNPQLYEDQQKAREKAIIKYEEFVRDQNQQLLYARKNRNKNTTKKKFDQHLCKLKLQSFIKVELEEKFVQKQTKKMLKAIRSYQAKVHIDENKKKETGKLDGFWLLVTNHSEKSDMGFVRDTKMVVKPYQEKVVIESSFRDIKSFIEISPVHVWTEKHVRAHYTLCVLSYLIDRTLTLSLHARSGKESKEIVSHERLYEELAECRWNQIKLLGTGNETYGMTQQTDKQLDLLQRLDMTHLVADSRVKEMKQKVTEKNVV